MAPRDDEKPHTENYHSHPGLERGRVWPQGRPCIQVPNESELPKVHLPPDEHFSKYTEGSNAPAYNVNIWVQGRGAPRPIDSFAPLARKITNPPKKKIHLKDQRERAGHKCVRWSRSVDSADTSPRHRSESPSKLRTISFLHNPFLHFFSPWQYVSKTPG